MHATLHARAEALETRAANAAVTGAYARAAGMIADAELWEARAERLDSMARDYRTRAK